jgi:hypothetical protein
LPERRRCAPDAVGDSADKPHFLEASSGIPR